MSSKLAKTISSYTKLTPVIDEVALYRYLGYDSNATPDTRVVQTFEREKASLAKLLEPRGLWVSCDGSVCFESEFILHDRQVIVSVVTIGTKLEERVKEYADRGEVLRAFVLDTLGSVCAEGIAENGHDQLATYAESLGQQVGCRISPGYGDWDLRAQEILRDLLQFGKIGVRLTPGMMMVPRKSVSFAVEISADPVQIREGEQCEFCGMEHCRYRHQ